jgi:CheY-like chemotaxis protein
MLVNDKERSPEPATATPKAETVLGQYYRVFFVAIGVGLIAISLFPIQAPSVPQYFSVLTTALLFAAAFLAVGSLAGFLFGIPFANQLEKPKTPEEPTTTTVVEPEKPATEVVFKPYRPNTNLEQISDWLTKILVGVGLVQLSQVPEALRNFNQYVAPALGGWPGSGFFGVAILIYFVVLGFLILFVWTRVNLPLLYTQSDLDQSLAYKRGKEEGKLTGEKQALEQVAEKYSQAAAQAKAQEGEKGKRLLWVDDRPGNNQSEMRLLEDTLHVTIDISKSTDDALEKTKKSTYDLIVSDLGRPEGREAGLDLLRKLRPDSQTPFIIYSRMTSPDIEAKAAQQNAIATNSPVTLINKATAILKR